MERTLQSVADAVDGRLIGSDAPFGAVSTDTRAIERGALFVALRGERFDGHAFIDVAAQQGAAGVMVSTPAAVDLPQVAVRDTRCALGEMAGAWRRSFAIPVVAITGSAGKTTVKELTASILGAPRDGGARAGLRVCMTQGNLNNDIGLPLTLMRLSADHDAAVVELGANHAGEIDLLARLSRPTVGVITNAGAAHLEGFGSIAGVAAAKGELLEHLPTDGTAVLNADDGYCDEWRRRTTADRVLTFGLRRAADFALATDPVLGPRGARFAMRTPFGVIDIELSLLGPTNVLNALAAAAAAHAAGAGADDIVAGLARAKPVRGRMHASAAQRGAVVIDDSYNANPSSVRAALQYLATVAGTRVMVLGDMLELGPEAAQLHREMGEHATGRCDLLVTVGELARHAADAFAGNKASFDTADDAISAVADRLGPNVTVLVKGSRAMGLERIVSAIAAGEEGAPC